MIHCQQIRTSLLLFFCLLSGSLTVQAVEVIDEHGQLKNTLTEDKLYNAQGQYQGMITPERKMYNEKGNFSGQINNNAIIDEKGEAKAYIRDGKIYDTEGTMKTINGWKRSIYLK